MEGSIVLMDFDSGQNYVNPRMLGAQAIIFFDYIGTTRIITEGGLAFARGPMVAQTFTSYAMGSTVISPQSMTALALSYAGFCEIKTSFMPALAHGAKLSDAIRSKRRRIVWAVIIAVVLAVCVSIPWTIYLGYRHGAYNFSTWIFTPGGRLPYDYMVMKIAKEREERGGF